MAGWHCATEHSLGLAVGLGRIQQRQAGGGGLRQQRQHLLFRHLASCIGDAVVQPELGGA